MAMMDRGASALAKLKNKAQKSGKSLQLHLQLFCQEEFLRRLSLSPYADNLVLKGGLFIYTLTNFESRATVDIDFLLRQLPATPAKMQEVVETILAVDTGNDFIHFTALGYEQISPHRKYQGVSFQIVGQIKNTKTPFCVDLGVGDVIIPKSEKQEIPVQLDGYEKPVVATYSLESTIAEKFDAILQRLELTSRMKDFYDIRYLSHTFDFDGRQLQRAIVQTFRNRKTAYEPNSLERITAFSENREMEVQWRRFLQRARLPALPFDQVLREMSIFLSPVWQAIIAEQEPSIRWHAAASVWQQCL